MDRRQISYFAAIVEQGSMVKASRSLHVSQPSLSVVVQKLEKEFGTPLLVRTPQGVTPTEAGRYLHDAGQRILNSFSDLETHLRDAASGRTGHVTVASTPTYTWGYMPELLTRLSAAAPGIEVELRDPPPLQIVQQVLDAAVALGIVATYDPALIRRRYVDLEVTTLGPLQLVMTLPPNMPVEPGPVSLRDLTDQPWVIPTTSTAFPGLAQLTERIWADHQFAPRVVRKVSTAQTALPLVAGGMGVALMPKTVRNVGAGSIQVRTVSEDLPCLYATLIRRRGAPLTPVMGHFIDLAADIAT